jgi:arylsulfatase B
VALARWTALSLCLLGACERQVEPVRAPHVVVLVADDLGWGEVGYQGGTVPTPNIDRLAAEGVVLERFYASPMCSATRAALLTGRDAIRSGLAAAVIAPWREFGLPPAEVTLAEALAERGYRARGAFGKWHLGHLRRRWHPLSQGFTHFRGHYNGAIDHFEHTREGERDWHRGLEPVREEGWASALTARAAAEFIDAHARAGPMLCYVAFSAVHAPFQAPPELLGRFAHLAEADGSVGVRQARAAMLAGMDEAVGVVLAALERAGASEDTLLWFLSDNGAGPEDADGNEPWRGHKLTLHEGALRVPALVRWPSGGLGPRLEGGVVSVSDIVPTTLAACGAAPRPGPALDGVDLTAVLRGTRAAPERELGFACAQDGPEHELVAWLTPRWKLIVEGPDLARAEGTDAHTFELYAIADDPHERRDLASDRPEVVRELTGKLRAYRARQPSESVAPYWSGHEGFVPPRDWRIPDED